MQISAKKWIKNRNSTYINMRKKEKAFGLVPGASVKYEEK